MGGVATNQESIPLSNPLDALDKSVPFVCTKTKRGVSFEWVASVKENPIMKKCLTMFHHIPVNFGKEFVSRFFLTKQKIDVSFLSFSSKRSM